MQPKPAHLGDAYAAQFSDRSVVEAYRYRPPYPEETFSMLAGLMAPGSRRVLDAGCGTGDLARGLLPFVDRIDAVDWSEAMIATGRSRPSGDDPRLHWIVGQVETAPLSPPYALVTAGESLHWMDWATVMPRFAEVLVLGSVLATVGRHTKREPWADDLGAIIDRYSTNREFRAYDLIDELTQRGLFTVHGTLTTSPVRFRQSVEDYVESFHSRNGFSRDRMTAEQAAAFDEEATRLVAPYAADGMVELTLTARIDYGVPHRAA